VTIDWATLFGRATLPGGDYLIPAYGGEGTAARVDVVSPVKRFAISTSQVRIAYRMGYAVPVVTAAGAAGAASSALSSLNVPTQTVSFDIGALGTAGVQVPVDTPDPITPPSDLIRKSILVGFHVKVIEGSFSNAEVNAKWLETIQLLDGFYGRRIGGPEGTEGDVAPGNVIFDSEDTLLVVENAEFGVPGVSVFDIADSRTERDGSDLYETQTFPLLLDGSLLTENEYTVMVKAVLAYIPAEADDPGDPSWYGTATGDPRLFYTPWEAVPLRVNIPPEVTDLQTNGEVSPERLLSSDPVEFGFLISDPDGPSLQYRIQVGDYEGGSFSPIWDTEWVSSANDSGSVQISGVSYQGPLVAGLRYLWRARAQNPGLDVGNWSQVASFRRNAAPAVSSLKVDGFEALFGNIPRVAFSAPVVDWTYSSDEAPQQYFELYYRQENWVAEEVIKGEGETSSVTLPSFDQDRRVFLRLVVSDGLEETEVEATVLTSLPPRVTRLLTESLENPTSLSTATPAFSWSLSDAENLSQRAFRVQVASDPDFNDLVWDTGQITSNNTFVTYGTTASPVVGPDALTHGVYFVRVAVSNGTTWSELEDCVLAFFAINAQPAAPTLVSPVAGRYAGPITVAWTPASPADSDATDTITYVVEITETKSRDVGWRRLVGPLPAGQTSYVIGADDLPSGEDYGVRVVASDGITPSDPATSPAFAVENHAPVSPVFSSPASGQVAARFVRAEWIEADPVDVDGDAVNYKVEISSNASSSDVVWRLAGTLGAGITSLLIDVSEEDDGTDFQLRITAVDQHGKEGTPSLSPKFEVNNAVTVSDTLVFAGETYLSTSDGRLLRMRESGWQVVKDWSDDGDLDTFEVFSSEGGIIEVADGVLIFRSPPGETALLREE
jgi:hypothetical protein